MYVPQLSVVLRLADSVGLSYWCVKIDPAYGRPDLEPSKPWSEVEQGDVVRASDGMAYEIDRLVPIEVVTAEREAADVLPECRRAIDALAGRPSDGRLGLVPR
jgi:hypothetical protein